MPTAIFGQERSFDRGLNDFERGQLNSTLAAKGLLGLVEQRGGVKVTRGEGGVLTITLPDGTTFPVNQFAPGGAVPQPANRPSVVNMPVNRADP